MQWLFSWEVTSWAVGILVAIGLGLLAVDDFRLAKLFFLLAAADAAGGVVMWGINTPLTTWYRTVLVFVLTGAIGVLLVWSLRYVGGKEEAKKSLEPSTQEKGPFSVSLDVTLFGPTRDNHCGFWLVSRNLSDVRVYPVNAALFLTIVNRQSIQSMIASYRVEMRTADGRWAPLISLPALPYYKYFGTDLKRTRLVADKGLFLEEVIANRSLQPHETVRGWTLFQYSKRYGPMFEPEFKITIMDYAGASYSCMLSSKPGDVQGGAQPQTIPIGPGEPLDLSKLRIGFYRDE